MWRSLAASGRKLRARRRILPKPPAGSATASVAMSRPKRKRRVAEAAIKEFGHVDILVNNAGINIRNPIEKLSLAEFRQVQESNVVGPWLVCRGVAAISNLAARGG